MHAADPKSYMHLVRAIREGTHDRSWTADTDAVEASDWFEHFKELLGRGFLIHSSP